MPLNVIYHFNLFYHFFYNFVVMDIQTRKIEFIQAFLKLQNEKVISLFENLLKSETRSALKPMSIEKLNERVDRSIFDSKNDNVTEVKSLLKEIKEWN